MELSASAALESLLEREVVDPAAVTQPKAAGAETAEKSTAGILAEGSTENAKAGDAQSKGVPERKKSKTTAADRRKLQLCAYALAGVLAVMIAGVLVFERWIRRVETSADRAAPDAESQQQNTSLSDLFSGIKELGSPYFGTKAGWKGRMFVAQLAFFVGLGMFRMFVENNWRQQFWDCFQSGTAREFRHLMFFYLILLAVGVLSGVYDKYIRWLLYIDWRTHMTQSFVHKWLSSRAYCGVARNGVIDNPDQRLQQDVSAFTQLSVDLSNDFVSQCASLVLFLPLLYMKSPEKAFGLFYCPGWLFYLIILYALAGTYGTHYFGKLLIPISFARQRAEANFRHELVEVRDHAEAVALAQGEQRAASRLQDRFLAFRGTFWHFMQTNKQLMYFKHVFGFLNWVVPFCILAPSFFRGEITLGQLFQLIHVIDHVQSSMDWLIDSYEPLSKWRACADRLLQMDWELREHIAQAKRADDNLPGACSVVATDLVLRVKDTVLWTCPRLEIPRGWVLLHGPQGVGKSSLLKVLAGTLPSGGGAVHLPASRVFVPEQPYVPISTLRDALLYPQGDRLATESALRTVLRDVGLGYLETPGSLESALTLKAAVRKLAGARLQSSTGGTKDEEDARVRLIDPPVFEEAAAPAQEQDWMAKLSMGERQRLVIAQLLLRSPRPDVVFLDESFSHVSGETARSLCGMLRRRLPRTSVLQVTRDMSLRAVHDHVMGVSVQDGVFVAAAEAVQPA